MWLFKFPRLRTTVPRREKLARHFLGRGLPGAAGDGHDLRSRCAPDRLRQRLQRRRRVIDLDHDRRALKKGSCPFPAQSRPRSRSTTTPAAPARTAAGTKSAPSNRSPRIAKNRSPGARVLVSIDTAPNSRAASPRAIVPCTGARAPATHPAVSRMVHGFARFARLSGLAHRGPNCESTRPPRNSCACPAPRAPRPHRRTAAPARRSPGTSRAPCRR